MITLPASRIRWGVVTALFCLMPLMIIILAFSPSVYPEDRLPFLLLGCAFFLMPMLLGLRLLPRLAHLTISPQGYTEVVYGRSRFIPWAAVETINLVQARAVTLVAVSFVPQAKAEFRQSIWTRSATSKTDRTMADTWSLSARNLGELMGQYRAAALGLMSPDQVTGVALPKSARVEYPSSA